MKRRLCGGSYAWVWRICVGAAAVLHAVRGPALPPLAHVIQLLHLCVAHLADHELARRLLVHRVRVVRCVCAPPRGSARNILAHVRVLL